MPVDRFFSAVSEVKIRVAILEVMRINNQSLSAFLYMCRHDFAGLKYVFIEMKTQEHLNVCWYLKQSFRI